jgi:hypothetical protein
MNIIALEAEKHANLRLSPDRFYSHIVDQHILPIVISEMPQVASCFPIAFMKQQDTGKFKLAAIFGLEPGENLVFTGETVNTHYVPVNVRRYPFFIGTDEEGKSDRGVLCFDDDAKQINTENGEPFFTEDKKPSKLIEQVSSLLNELIATQADTDNFIDFLVEHQLIRQIDLTLTLGDQGEKKLHGLYAIDQEKLFSLDDTVVAELHKRRYFPAIYAQLISLHQVNRLLQLKAAVQLGKG